MNQRFLMLLFTLFCSITYGQNRRIDSLDKALRKAKTPDSLIVRKTCTFFLQDSQQNFEMAIKDLNYYLNTPLIKKNKYNLASVLYYIGSVYSLKSKYVEAIKYLEETVLITKELNSPYHKKIILQSTYGNLGLAYTAINDYENGFKYIEKSLPYAIEGSQETALYTYNFAGYIASSMGNYERAMAILKEGLKYRSKNPKSPEHTLNVLRSILEIEIKLKKNENTNKVITIADSLKNSNELNHEATMEFYIIKGLFYKKNKEFEKAFSFFEKAIFHANKYNYPPAISQSYFYTGEILNELNQYIKAEKFYKTALEIARVSDNNLYIEILEKIAIFYEKRKDFKQSSRYFKRVFNYKDSLISIQNHDKLLVNDAKYQLTEKNKSLEKLKLTQIQNKNKLKRQNTLIYSLLTGILIAATIGFIGYRNLVYRKKITEQENTQLKQQQQLTATESIIKGQEVERGRLAKDLHDGLGGILSSLKYSLTSMTGNLILTEQGGQIFGKALETLETAIGEMRRVAHSMMPETLLKFGLKDAVYNYCEGITHSGQLNVNFQAYGLENRLEQSVEVTVYRIIQELLNNVMKHAQASKALVQITKTDDLLTLTIEDDGIGFDKSILNQKKGIGISNVDSRVAYLGGQMEIQSDKCTSIIIEIPIKNA